MSNINYRIGHAKDIHQLVIGRKLILGGVLIEFSKGAKAHSDGDVLLHAISESLLGALALGDLGTHFPGTDEYRDIDSRVILGRSWQMIKERGYQIVNIDASIYLEKPRLSPYIMAMRQTIAVVLGINVDQISIKAGTNEGIGAIGSQKAVAAEAVCLLKGES